jgi:hypothetical protein
MIGDIIVEMAGMGYILTCGPHYDLLGYFASFQIPADPEDAPNEVPSWEECGHGVTAEEAVVMAQQLALGQFSGPVPEYTEFVP